MNDTITRIIDILQDQADTSEYLQTDDINTLRNLGYTVTLIQRNDISDLCRVSKE